jgi:probable selenium-dependent hydroxylase accessory protein YqeC
MYSLADQLVSAGKRVLTTTTTKIFKPTPEECPLTILSKRSDEIIEKARLLMLDCPHITLGAEYEPLSGKLIGVYPDILADIQESNLFDYIIIEADGAARKSLKACTFNEPVVPEFTDCLVSMAGLDVVGKPLDEQWVFRSNIFSNVTKRPLTSKITESDIAEMLIHDIASIKVTKPDVIKIAFLNKADNSHSQKAGNEIAALIEERARGRFHRVIVAGLKGVPVIHKCRVLS